MLRIRFTRMGRRNLPVFRVVVAENRRPIKGKFIEILGHHNPQTKELVLQADRIKYWLSVGAKPSPSVHNKLVDLKILASGKVKASKTRTKKKDNAAETSPKSTEEKVESSEKSEEQVSN